MFECQLFRVVVAMLSANGVLKMVYWLVSSFSIVIHRCTQLAPHRVLVFLEPSAFRSIAGLLHFLLIFDRFDTEIQHFIISSSALFKKKEAVSVCLALALTLFCKLPAFLTLVISDKCCNCSCH